MASWIGFVVPNRYEVPFDEMEEPEDDSDWEDDFGL